jgi:hypothetical protein
MGLVNDLFDRLGHDRYDVSGLPDVPPGFEWLLYQRDGRVFVELYEPSPMVCSYGYVDSTNANDVLAYARQIFTKRFDQRLSSTSE